MPTPSKKFRAALAGQTLPVLALVASITMLGAPVAFYVVSVSELERQGNVFAHDLAATLRVEAQARPALWRYDSSKILEHLRAFRLHDQLLEIRVYDARERLIAERESIHEASAQVWTWAPVASEREEANGSVWVSMSLDRARSSALRLLAPFMVLGFFLSWLLFVLPRRALQHAERETDDAFRRLRTSEKKLSELNESLEDQVEVQVEELQRAYDELRNQESYLRKLAAEATSAQVEERRAIGRDLHDAAGQVLTAIRLNLQRLANKRDDPEKVQELTQVTLKQVDGVMEEVRRTLAALGPAVVSEIGLRRALARHCEDVASWAPFALVSEISEGERELPPVPAAVETACYRIAQEALTNVARHAKASVARVSLHQDDAGITLRVRDDGDGFTEAESETGMGLRSMRERAELLGGGVKIESADGGTTIEAHFPLG
ncbi:MAG: ATP-binding protein [Polyangiales bacterium]